MSLDRIKLHAACRDLAVALLKENEKSGEVVETAAALFFSICETELDSIASQSRDPNLLTRAVRYLTHTHAWPTGVDAAWFQDSLFLLLELAVPRRTQNPSTAAFLDDVLTGIEISTERIDLGSNKVP